MVHVVAELGGTVPLHLLLRPLNLLLLHSKVFDDLLFKVRLAYLALFKMLEHFRSFRPNISNLWRHGFVRSVPLQFFGQLFAAGAVLNLVGWSFIVLSLLGILGHTLLTCRLQFFALKCSKVVWVALVALRYLTQVVYTLVEVKKCLFVLVKLLGILLFVPLFHLAYFFLASVLNLDVRHVGIWVFLDLDHIHRSHNFGRVNHATVTLALLKPFVKEINL